MSSDSRGCSECGAGGCEMLFHACLAADFSDAGYGVVHHLVVPAYGLQHGWYPHEAQAQMVEFILRHLDRPPTDHDRRTIRVASDGQVQVRARQPRSRHLDWEHHIGDIEQDSADRYVATVRTWAASVATLLLDAEQTTRPTGTGTR